jgi:hypothetical protein
MSTKESSHEHSHDINSEPSGLSPWWIVVSVIGLTAVFGLLRMGYQLVSKGTPLTEYQGFVIAVLTAVFGLVTALIVKIAIDRRAAQKARYAYQLEMSQILMKHEETLETIRKQGNGMLHKRDEQNDNLMTLVSILVKENKMLKESSTKTEKEEVKEYLLQSTDAVVELVEKIEVADSELKDLPPFAPKDK